MINNLDIIIAQLNPTVGDLGGNFDKITQVINAHPDADLIVFPEMITTGYPTDDLVLYPFFMDEVERRIHDLCDSIKTPVLLPTPWRDNGKLYNAALVIEDEKITHKIFKHHLPNYGVFDEKRIFTQGALPDIFTLKGVKIGAMICEDMWFSDVAAHLKGQGAEILIIPNGSPYQIDILEQRIAQATARVNETALPLLYVNQVGGQDELVFDGGSFAMNATGNIIFQLPFFEEIVSPSPSAAKASPPSPQGRGGPSKTRTGEGSKTIYNALTLGLRDYVQKNNFPGVLIGLSGGVDSALSAAIAVDAIGADNVHCVMMPSPYTSQDSLNDAKQCAEMLGVTYDILAIEEVMSAFDQALGNNIDRFAAGTTFENIQSRARGVLLMALSNANGKMVLSTGNKSEMAVGYATLYGDMCGGFNALKDLYKGQVYALCEWRNTQGAVIPERIITKAPSAELKPDQTDQDTLPPYDVLDDILVHLIERNTAPQDIPHDQELVLRIWRMLDRAEYKRRQAPPGVKITSRAFGRNRRYPITNGFKV